MPTVSFRRGEDSKYRGAKWEESKWHDMPLYLEDVFQDPINGRWGLGCIRSRRSPSEFGQQAGRQDGRKEQAVEVTDPLDPQARQFGDFRQGVSGVTAMVVVCFVVRGP
jgi:hypothetical protein